MMIGHHVFSQRTGSVTYFDKWWSKQDSDTLDKVAKLAEADPGDSDLYVFLTYGGGSQGIAYMNSVCIDSARSRVSLTQVSDNPSFASKAS